MNAIRIKPNDWVVVCDGRKALFTVNAGDADYLNLTVLEEHEAPSRPTHEQGADRPGRMQQSSGGGGSVGHGGSRSAVSQTDWHDQDEHDFLRSVAERINRAVNEGKVEGLIVAAPPRALGVLRPLLSAATQKVLREALDKDYVNLPVYEIEKRLKP